MFMMERLNSFKPENTVKLFCKDKEIKSLASFYIDPLSMRILLLVSKQVEWFACFYLPLFLRNSP